APLIPRPTPVPRCSHDVRRARPHLFLVSAFAFLPVAPDCPFQQVAPLGLLLRTALLWAALRRPDGIGGVLLALAASLKVSPLFFIPMLARLGRWRMAITGSVLLVVLTAITIVLAPQSWEFFTVVLPRIGLGTANWDNGSIDGLVSRIAELAPGLLGAGTQSVAK